MFTVYSCCNCGYMYEGWNGPQPDCPDCGGVYFKMHHDIDIKELKVDLPRNTL